MRKEYTSCLLSELFMLFTEIINRRSSISKYTGWIALAWKKIAEYMEHPFKKCYTFNVIDDTEYNSVWKKASKTLNLKVPDSKCKEL